MSLTNAPVPNFEEAANVAAEFIYSIDNLPNEVSHILQEIKHRETRTQELQQEIDRDTAKYIRRSRRASPASVTPPSPSSRAPSPKSLPIPARVSASYAEIHDLAGEKCVLAERLIEIISRTRSKLDVDIVKVRTLQGEPPEVVAASIARPLPSVATLGAEGFGAPGRNPALAISESLRNALAPAAESRVASVAPPSPSPSGSLAHVNRKRGRVAIVSSIKISPAASPKHRSASPTVLPSTAHTQQKSRLSRQVHPPPEYSKAEVDTEEGGDMEEEENEDETLYCFCQKQSYGDMIACDNDDGCPYEWFHLPCVGLKQPTPEKWFCSPGCAKTKGLTTSTNTTTTTTRKGRKK